MVERTRQIVNFPRIFTKTSSRCHCNYGDCLILSERCFQILWAK